MPTTTALSTKDDRVQVAGMDVARVLHDFLVEEVLPEIGVDADAFWQGFAAIVADLTPRNKELLERREELQRQLDEYFRANPGRPDPRQHEEFLRSIGYLEPTPEKAEIRTENTDPEFSEIAGPQLVVPVLNARFALNATNARWGSLYDALYGTDVIPEEGGAHRSGPYNPVRGAKVIAWGRAFLDEVVPLDGASHTDVESYSVVRGSLCARVDGECIPLKNPKAYKGFVGDFGDPSSIILYNNGLHIDIRINPASPVGKTDRAGVEDIVLEAATATIIDFEDSVAAVDATDKTLGYRNWFGLNTGSLKEEVTKGDKTFTRALNPDRTYISRTGSQTVLKGRSTLLVRNVGHLMTNPAILIDGEKIYEGIMDAVITAACAIPGTRKDNPLRNTVTGSIYMVKPKQHGSQEVAFTNELFSRVEQLLGLEPNTLKVGVMDEERRTSANLDACIQAVSQRLAFINTGFLDRTGDEIHTSMEAGAMVRKADMQTAPWKQAYEDNNVDVGLERGLSGRAQIGKGMWAKTELMAEMVEQKIGQLHEGANTAWVPSPTAATLHATHYHKVDVRAVQQELVAAGRRDTFADLLTVPVAQNPSWSPEEIKEEVDNNCQSILGYVVRWVEQGIGCSKVPDIHNVDLMEDRATLRISSQLLANWLRHGIITTEQVVDSLKRMAVVVDKQNEGDAAYLPMSRDYDYSIAFQAAKDLILKGTESPAGYTEPILHARRREFKQREGIA
ncbi:malate synthase G [Corynebacterium oculi]|uniref:Malate synthase G n=1 Tax=Corynebacterium oculi TaxID=1544416 RepID=A0A0N8VZF0_9CORY|nr:malate synthase G [Corynebacterium oculi]KQB83714.1 Malate synthase G [Corynebacterium oculi]